MRFFEGCLILFLLFSCQSLIKYKSDIGFLNSAQANSAEYLVYINSKVCKDMDGEVGSCAKSIRSDAKLSFKMDKRPYSYRLVVTCSSNVNLELKVDVPKDSEYAFELLPENFSGAKAFTCIGDIFPQDREQELSAFWHARILVIDNDYSAREQISMIGEQLILGEHAKYINVDGKLYSKKTVLKAEGVKRVYTESEIMRFNYHGY